MSREIKRVALDLRVCRGEVWKGYQRPPRVPCPKAPQQCFNGQTPGGAWLEAVCRFIVLLGEQSVARSRQRERYPHPSLLRFAQAPTDGGSYTTNARGKPQLVRCPRVLPPSPDLRPLIEQLIEQPLDGSVCCPSSWKLQKKLLELGGEDPESWGLCPVCKGRGIHPDHQAAWDAWRPTEPPSGPGWQVWERVSEGSPVSPVFGTAEELIEWLCQPKGSDEIWTSNGHYANGTPYCYSEQGQTREAAEAFVLGSGWTPSAMHTPDAGFVSGIGVAEHLQEK